MFQLEQIKEAHSKVQSGADFPAYIRELLELGVLGYTIFVTDGHQEYFGTNGYRIADAKTYLTMAIAPFVNKRAFH